MFTGLCFKQPQTERRAALQAQCHAQLPNTVLTRTELWRTRVILYSDTNKSCPCYSRLSPFFSKHNSVTWKSGLHYQMQSQILSIQRFKKKKNTLIPLWGKKPVKTFQKNKYLRGSKAGLITRNQLTHFLSLSFPLRKPPPSLACRCRRAAPSCICFISLRIGTVTSTWHFHSWLISNTNNVFQG